MADPLMGLWDGCVVLGDVVVWVCALTAMVWSAMRIAPGAGWGATIAIAAVLGGMSVDREVHGRGTGLVPTSALIWWAVNHDAQQPRGPEEVTPVQRELRRRMADGGLRDWQWRWVLKGARALRVPARWTVDAHLPIIVDAPAWMGVDRVRVEPRLRSPELIGNGPELQGAGFLAPGSESAEFEVSVKLGATLKGRWVWTGVVAFPVRIVATQDDAFRACRSPELDAAVRGAMRVRVRQGSRGARIMIHLDRAEPPLAHMAMGLKVEVLCDGAVLRTGYLRVIENGEQSATWMWAGGFNWFEQWTWKAPIDGELARWSLRIRSGREESMPQFELGRFWEGAVEFPMSEVFVDEYR